MCILATTNSPWKQHLHLPLSWLPGLPPKPQGSAIALALNVPRPCTGEVFARRGTGSGMPVRVEESMKFITSSYWKKHETNFINITKGGYKTPNHLFWKKIYSLWMDLEFELYCKAHNTERQWSWVKRSRGVLKSVIYIYIHIYVYIYIYRIYHEYFIDHILKHQKSQSLDNL